MSDAPGAVSFASLIPFIKLTADELVEDRSSLQPILDRLEPDTFSKPNTLAIIHALSSLDDTDSCNNIQTIEDMFNSRAGLAFRL